MIERPDGFATRVAQQGVAAQWAAHAGMTFAQEKRHVDAAYALAFIQGHAKNELVNALRNIGQQLRP
ncbi:hypothetical protein [Trinickia soli]|nr:hypothetical protein [Trinickia soli]CAB3649762.1 hypothetical protein LMG24076_00878 [Trinickia soli]